MTEDYVNFLITYALPKPMSLREIQQATKDDKTLHFIEMISANQWETNADCTPEGVDLTELQLFGRIRYKSMVTQDADVIILRGDCIVMPNSLPMKVIKAS